jgi:hypothetical protein|tara:strand:- start:45 stop:197 length:153 start_codon:yes stop_codon:yes gene_type:complete
MTTEDNYTMPNSTIAEYLELGYTKAYAKALVAMQQRVAAKRAFYAVWDQV